MLIPSERQRNQLRRAAQDDALTNLLNRGGFSALAGRQLSRCRQAGQPCTVLLMDLDHFKRVNDTYGHEAGDRLLCAFAEAVRAQSRATDLVARYGGEEFCALLTDTDSARAVAVAERIRHAFAAVTVPVKGGAMGTTVSIGVAELLPAGESLEQALRRADHALYAAKHAGRDRVVAAEPVAALPSQ
jgi:diguanylate cyclase (GGDEF)-like protein